MSVFVTERIMPETKEWLDEPNREEFEHAGYKCLIVRHPELLHLCGYVGVLPGHPCYRKHYDYLPYDDLFPIHVHGGLTWSDMGNGKTWPEGYWWFGFDCGHAYDFVPYMEDIAKRFGGPSMQGTYRNFNFVRLEVQSLSYQMAILDFIDWQFAWVWPLLLPVRAARRIWAHRRKIEI